ncbi:LOW QUALITY PROTEIN: hypothetical protein ACHAWF_003482 [Thalassiosira exigua]
MIPLLHLLIGVGNNLLENLRDWFNRELESIYNQEYRTCITTAEHLIIDQCNDWDVTADGKNLKSLKNKVRACKKWMEKLGVLISIVSYAQQDSDDSPIDVQELLHQFSKHVDAQANEVDAAEDEEECYCNAEEREGGNVLAKVDMIPLLEARAEIAGCLTRTRQLPGKLKNKLKSVRSDRHKAGGGLEGKMSQVLKEIGVELTRYHGGKLNGKDIKTIIENATYSGILVEGKREWCPLSEDEIKSKVNEHPWTFLLWDGPFLFARKVDPTTEDPEMFRRFVNATVDCHTSLGCNITHKVHLMWKHVAWQMGVVPGGLGGRRWKIG